MTTDKNGYIELNVFEKTQLLERLEAGYTESRRLYRAMRLRWYVTERYLDGAQWGREKYSENAGNATRSVTLTDGSGNVDEEFLIDNMMLRIFMLNQARMTRYQANIDLAPNSDSQDDKTACRKGRVVLYDLLEKNNFSKLKQKLARGLLVTGKGWLKVTFDPFRGRPMAKPIYDAYGNIKFDTGHEGEVRIDCVSSRNIQIPAYAVDRETMDWLQETNVRTIDYVSRAYGHNVKAEAISLHEDLWSYGFDPNGGGDGKRADLNKDAQVVLVKERYYRPSKEYPRGAIFTWANGQLLRSSTLLDFYEDIPYFDASFVMKDNSVWADTPFYHLIQHQDELNRLESEVMRHTKLMCKPKLLKHSGTSFEEFTNETGEEVEWDGTIPPSYLQPATLPNDVYENIQRTVDRMMVLSAAQDIVRPPRSRSGNAIAFEQEMDETTLAPVLESVEDCWRQALKFALYVVSDMYDVPRLAKMTNSSRTVIEQTFVGADLKGNFDVRISLMNGLPANKLARQQYIFQAVDKKIITPEVGAKYLEFGEAEEAMRQMQAEIEIAQKTVKTMESGHWAPVHEFDNHEVMAAEMIRAMRERYDEWKPQVQAMFDAALKLHQKALLLSMMPANKVLGPDSSSIDPTKPGYAPQETAMDGGQVSGAEPEEGEEGLRTDREVGQDGTRELITESAAGAPQNI